MLCQSAIAEGLPFKITEDTKKMVGDYYEGKFSGYALRAFVLSLTTEFGSGTDNAYKALFALLPKLFEVIAAEAKRPYWFWRTHYKKSDWWKALSAKGGLANDFLAYLYNINTDDSTKKLSGVQAVPEKGYIVYTLDGKEFKKESTSFFKKYWGKIARGEK